MNCHFTIFHIHIQDTVFNSRQKELLSIWKSYYIYIICPCFQYIFDSAYFISFIIIYLQTNQICDKVFIWF